VDTVAAGLVRRGAICRCFRSHNKSSKAREAHNDNGGAHLGER
jgi:hypothetical protein